jgi:HD-GYP domain-containing protein (c-di-GMP phosphodiesterase class II)
VIFEGLAVLVLGGAATLIAGRFGPFWTTVSVVAVLPAAWAAAAALMALSGCYLSPLFPTLGLAGNLLAIVAAGFIVERRRADQAGIETLTSRRLMIQTLLSLVEVRDAETGLHSRRTRELTRVLAETLAPRPSFREDLTPERIELLATLAPLHDIGKVGVPDSILRKPGPLTPEEWQEMRRHPEYGRDVIVKAEHAAGVRDDLTLAIAKDIVFTHHERWDGTGYPQGLRGTAIPLAGRLLAVVDVYDALLAPRPYHRSMTHEEAMAIISEGRGTHFDPEVVDACVKVSAAFERLSTTH